ncbi:MAG: HD domain-containing protein [Treponema sp.]|nr:HD domain-containing protein [Treponema sp.]
MIVFSELFKLTEAVRDPIWHHIYLTEPLMNATKTQAFRRLWNIQQLGPTSLIYPGATHTRASHSFGVYHVALRLLNALCEKGATQWVTKQGCSSFLAAALFHDIGHFPYTHSLKELPLKDHEDLSSSLILSEPLKTLISKTGADPEQTAAIVKHSNSICDDETIFFRMLLSGVLDPDKLDYLNRDAYYCGVPYGIQDTDYILSRLEPNKKMGICLDFTGIISVEHVLFSKYMMYRAVYWHKNVRIATAMMKKTIFAALQKNLICPEELYSLDDSSIFSLISSKNFAEKSCSEQLKNHNLFRIIAEIPFDETNENHLALENLEKRTNAEMKLAEYAETELYNILIDIPERISFESDLWISGKNCVFSSSSTVFTQSTIKSFTQNLRIIRVGLNRNEATELRIKKLKAECEKLLQ